MSSLSPEQLDKYLTHISLPEQYRQASPSLDLLKALQTSHIGAIPFENLGLHYTKDPKISLDVQDLFRKMTRNGRGGYCMENNTLFNHVLRALGFQVYQTGARVINMRDQSGREPCFWGWGHAVNIVTLPDGTRYMADVGFGGDGPREPLPLVSGHVTRNIGTQDVRLVYDTIPDVSQRDQKLWIYQYRNAPEQAWRALYCFPDALEFLDADFAVMNYATSHNPESFFTFEILVVKFLRREGEVYGKVMLVNDVLKRNLRGKTEVVKTCQTEEERVTVLRVYFGIHLSEEEKNGIRGRVTELRPEN
ncbi:cysteine proteinase [Gloeophyllum trabeum ATCC 11539]|uniref:Cysteine proteinase n=1 Tax=Gloeophyllum trabeum (strain ATCC 11539 / FP-39264 / Madison 617) TaxID=670483 RepID=S7QC73_GLOTA|nr:cysteine proteinase [Gloeophyllum trabeum ATCC 11539]EPQ56963.1 cysteine proteinase [Gloeophyllum trabeum ATCC 11539]